LDFFIVGDYGWVEDLIDSEYTFGWMDQIYGAAKNSTNPDTRDLIDFIMTVGDNLYPQIDVAPTQQEFEEML